MTTGAPKIGVTALRGNMPADPGKMHIRLHKRAIADPAKMVTGNNDL